MSATYQTDFDKEFILTVFTTGYAALRGVGE